MDPPVPVASLASKTVEEVGREAKAGSAFWETLLQGQGPPADRELLGHKALCMQPGNCTYEGRVSLFSDLLISTSLPSSHLHTHTYTHTNANLAKLITSTKKQGGPLPLFVHPPSLPSTSPGQTWALIPQRARIMISASWWSCDRPTITDSFDSAGKYNVSYQAQIPSGLLGLKLFISRGLK